MTLTTDYEHTTNGTTTPPPTGPRIPRRETWVDLPAEYPGFRIRLWANFPRRLVDEIGSDDSDRIRAAMSQIVLEHNGWVDFDGELLPPANTPEFWDRIPDEIAAALWVLSRLESGKLSTSLVPTTRRR